MQSPSFLYIEDHPASRKVMHMLLVEMMGFSDLTLLENTENFIEKLNHLKKEFDVIFLDVNLAPVDGFHVCQILRTLDAYQNTQIVAVTAATKPADLARMQSVGFNGAISKPLNMETFSDQVQSILAGDDLWEAF